MNTEVVQITNTFGEVTLEDDELYEPPAGSVLLTKGLSGTAWQRHASDGLWHATTHDNPRAWAYFLRQRNVYLIHETGSRA